MRLSLLFWLVAVFLLFSTGCTEQDINPDENDNDVRFSDAGDVNDIANTDTADIEESNTETEPLHCADGELSGDETDVDCGGSCSRRCQLGQSCKIRTDCVTLECDQEEFICITLECSNNCSFHGTCSEGLCECQPGWTGPSCSTPACFNECSDNGQCNAGTCSCDPGWTSIDCSVPTDPMSECLNNCSNRGICIEGNCFCESGWAGEDCSIDVSGGEQECSNNCSNNGVCNQGTCDCYPGWSGHDCSRQDCPNNCSGNGSCNNGNCNCNPGWSGDDCSIQE